MKLKRPPKARKKKKRASRSGTPWRRRADAPPPLGPVEQQALGVVLALRAELGREPEPSEVATRLGLRDARPFLATLAERGLPARLTPPQGKCLRAIAALEVRLGRSPTVGEVSTEMGLSENGSRWHIENLVRLGLTTPPRRIVTLSVTAIGHAHLT